MNSRLLEPSRKAAARKEGARGEPGVHPRGLKPVARGVVATGFSPLLAVGLKAR